MKRVAGSLKDLECQVKIKSLELFPTTSGDQWKGLEQGKDRMEAQCWEAIPVTMQGTDQAE